MRLQIKQNTKTSDMERKDIKRSYSSSNFLKKDNKGNNNYLQDGNISIPSVRYIEGAAKQNQTLTLTLNKSPSKNIKLDENTSGINQSVFRKIDSNIINNNNGFKGLHYHTPSMDKELKNLTQQLAVERSEIESELKKAQKEACKWKEKYEQLFKCQQNKDNLYQKSNYSINESDNIFKSQSDLNKNFNDSTNSLYNQQNTQRTNISERDVKLLAQKFALERVGLENQIKCLQNQQINLEGEVQNQIQENQHLRNMCKEIEKEKDQEVINFKRKLQENEIELKNNIQEEFIKLGENFNQEKASLLKQLQTAEEELEQVKRENQILVDTIHQLNQKSKSQYEVIQTLSSSKSEASILFQKVSQLENELQAISDQLQKEYENKQALTSRYDTERTKVDQYQFQLEEQKMLCDQLNVQQIELKSRNQELLNQIKQEQLITEQLRIENYRYQEQLEQNECYSVENNYLNLYQEEREKNSDLLEQIEEQNLMIQQMKERTKILEEISKTNQENFQIQNQNFQNLDKENANIKAEMKKLEYRCKMLEDCLSSSQKNLGEKEGQLGILEIELQSKQNLLSQQQEMVSNLQFQLKDHHNNAIYQQQISQLNVDLGILKNRFQDMEHENKKLKLQEQLFKDQISQYNQQLMNNEKEFNILLKEKTEMYDKQIQELKKVIEDKNYLIQELEFSNNQKESAIFTDYNPKKLDTERSEINIRNLETVYEQRINQIQHNQILEEEKLTNMLQTKNSEIKILQTKIDEYLRKMELLSSEMDKLQEIISQKDSQNIQLSQEINKLQLQIQQNFINHSNQASSTLQQGQSQISGLMYEIEQIKLQMKDQSQKDEKIKQDLESNLKLLRSELDQKNEECILLLTQKSELMASCFSKDNTINLQKNELIQMGKKMSQLEEESNYLKANQRKFQNKDKVIQYGGYGFNLNFFEKKQEQKLNESNFLQQDLCVENTKKSNDINQLQRVDERPNNSDLEKIQSSALKNQDQQKGEVEMLKEQITIFSTQIESKDHAIQTLRTELSKCKKEVEETRQNLEISEQNLIHLRESIVKILDENQRLHNRITEFQQNNSQQSQNVIQKNQFVGNLSKFSNESDSQTQQINEQKIQELIQIIDKCQFDKVLLAQEVERLQNQLQYKQKELEKQKEQISETFQNKIDAKVEQQNQLNDEHFLYKKINYLENKNIQQQCVVFDENLDQQQKRIELEKKIRKNFEEEIKSLVSQYLIQKCMYERIIAELKLQLGVLQNQLDEQDELVRFYENQSLQKSQNDELKKLVEIKISENKSLQLRLEATERQKNEEVRKLKKEIKKINDERLDKSSFELYAERIGYQVSIHEKELKIQELEKLIEIYQKKDKNTAKKRTDSIEVLKQIQDRNAWQVEFSKLIEELRIENEQLNKNMFEQQQTIAKLQLQNASLIISDSYYIISK
ncbi:hypothetical protein TTHERM_00531990 (macronuclear) [Tetrahymena thermophila SB210]|uniref:Uncharacterized protein n=1 Tax=Tetrahymena thermophila (strain SB210) TaxID=312017 RepID=Q248G8_TETTS|nr:hypothetical protein TTHERM_00531990 [Tetrahymena thermophila SB210]EAS04077.2 hypothetical protein TTHERM_00531990 [Tetrahymena thermophila SB210]|eukprot:XP_001024322.2 hypothetical protein TTHERM_00531990 [Tetrahymena thermophila SB210]